MLLTYTLGPPNLRVGGGVRPPPGSATSSLIIRAVRLSHLAPEVIRLFGTVSHHHGAFTLSENCMEVFTLHPNPVTDAFGYFLITSSVAISVSWLIHTAQNRYREQDWE